MLSKVLKKRAQLLAVILVLSLLLTATTAFAVSEYITAKKGGVIGIAQGVKLVILPRALKEDTLISADMLKKKKRIEFTFEPDGTVFAKPAILKIAWSAIEDLEDLVLYGLDGEKIRPRIKGWGLEYRIPHFSLYYFRRR